MLAILWREKSEGTIWKRVRDWFQKSPVLFSWDQGHPSRKQTVWWSWITPTPFVWCTTLTFTRQGDRYMVNAFSWRWGNKFMARKCHHLRCACIILALRKSISGVRWPSALWLIFPRNKNRFTNIQCTDIHLHFKTSHIPILNNVAIAQRFKR